MSLGFARRVGGKEVSEGTERKDGALRQTKCVCLPDFVCEMYAGGDRVDLKAWKQRKRRTYSERD